MDILIDVSISLVVLAVVFGDYHGSRVLERWFKNDCTGDLENGLILKGTKPCFVFAAIGLAVGIWWLLFMSFSVAGWVVAYLFPPVIFFLYWLNVMRSACVVISWTHVIKSIFGLIFWPVILIYLISTLISALVVLLADWRHKIVSV